MIQDILAGSGGGGGGGGGGRGDSSENDRSPSPGPRDLSVPPNSRHHLQHHHHHQDDSDSDSSGGLDDHSICSNGEYNSMNFIKSMHKRGCIQTWKVTNLSLRYLQFKATYCGKLICQKRITKFVLAK